MNNIVKLKVSEFGSVLGEFVTQDVSQAKAVFKHPFVLPEFEGLSGMTGFVEFISGGKRKTRVMKFSEIDSD